MTVKNTQIVNNQDDNQISIADHIIDGSIEIRSIEAFKGILKRFPNNWILLGMYADMLKKNGLIDEAAKSYEMAAQQSFKANKILEFIVLKLMQWRLCPPKKLDAKRVIVALKNKMGQETALSKIIDKLSFEEIIAILARFEIVHISAGEVIKKIGDLDESLYFVVSGTLRDSIFLTIENKEKIYRKPTIYLTENDYFGDIYPFDRENKFKSYIEAVEQAVLLKIPKKKLIKLCQKHPQIEFGLMDLFKVRRTVEQGDSTVKLRQSQRFQLTLDLNLAVYPKASTDNSINLRGFTSDISISGLCFIMDEESFRLSLNDSAFSKTIHDASVQINLSSDGLTLNIQGRVAWLREVSFEGRKTYALGVYFEHLTPKLKGLLIALFNGMGLNTKNL
jgi:CRP-like cAMP-binding protein